MNKRLQVGPGHEKASRNDNLDPFGPGNPRLQRKAQARSRVSNGHELLPNVDGRSLVARRYRDIMSAIASDQGGVDRLSEARLQLIRRFAAAACLAEQLEARPFACMPNSVPTEQVVQAVVNLRIVSPRQ